MAAIGGRIVPDAALLQPVYKSLLFIFLKGDSISLCGGNWRRLRLLVVVATTQRDNATMLTEKFRKFPFAGEAQAH
jgi:hypothetical protein